MTNFVFQVKADLTMSQLEKSDQKETRISHYEVNLVLVKLVWSNILYTCSQMESSPFEHNKTKHWTTLFVLIVLNLMMHFFHRGAGKRHHEIKYEHKEGLLLICCYLSILTTFLPIINKETNFRTSPWTTLVSNFFFHLFILPIFFFFICIIGARQTEGLGLLVPITSL